MLRVLQVVVDAQILVGRVDCDPAVNEYDWIYGTRNDKVEVVWAITGRGHSQ